MAEFCAQCAQQCGLKGSFAGLAKKGGSLKVWCDGCGEIKVDYCGMCLNHVHLRYKPEKNNQAWIDVRNRFLFFIAGLIISTIILIIKDFN